MSTYALKIAARLRLPADLVLTGLATFVSLCGLIAVFVLPGTFGVPSGAVLHGVSVWMALQAACLRRESPLSEAERDAVLVLASVVPVIGVAFAPSVPPPDDAEEAVTSHEVFERYQEYVKPSPPPYERSIFTGDFDRDLARKLDAQSYYDILKTGETGQKRSALRRLADLGRPEHLVLIRRCLEDPEHEVRLYAYGELSRLEGGFERDLVRCKEAVAESPNVENQTAQALVHLAYARSGVLDEATGLFHFSQALERAEGALGADGESAEAVVIAAQALAGLSRFDEATSLLAGFGGEGELGERARLARAEMAFASRDFDAARIEAEALLVDGRDLPEWLAALLSIAPVGGSQ